MDGLVIAAAVAGFVVSLFALYFSHQSIETAGDANTIARDANAIAQSSRDLSREGIDSARNASRAASVPQAYISNVRREDDDKLYVDVVNQGPGIAIGVIILVQPLPVRDLAAINPDAWKWTSRRATIPANDKVPGIPIVVAGGDNPWVVLRLEYLSALGVVTRLEYLYPLDPEDRRFRLHRVVLDVGQPGEIAFPVALGPAGD